MAEKAMSPHTFLLALTYNDETERSRRGASVFQYKDVQDFLRNVRRQIDYHLKRTGTLSYIACGEQGDRFKRCHWHVVLFGEVDFLSLGEWAAPWGKVTKRSDIISPVLGDPWRRTWSLWPHGFVTVQEPDHGGMRYAMAYALKDQFAYLKSEQTSRVARGDVFACGEFMMSKRPAIGARFINAQLAEWAKRGLVPPSCKLYVPEMPRPWWPVGILRTQLLEGIAAINRDVRAATGRDGAGWSSLLNECRLSDHDLEVLSYGVDTEPCEASEEGEEEEGGQAILASVAELASAKRDAAARRRCGSTYPCSLCIKGFPPEFQTEHGFRQDANGWFHTGTVGPKEFRAGQRDNSRTSPNDYCALKGTGAIEHLFPKRSARASSELAEGARREGKR